MSLVCISTSKLHIKAFVLWVDLGSSSEINRNPPEAQGTTLTDLLARPEFYLDFLKPKSLHQADGFESLLPPCRECRIHVTLNVTANYSSHRTAGTMQRRKPNTEVRALLSRRFEVRNTYRRSTTGGWELLQDLKTSGKQSVKFFLEAVRQRETLRTGNCRGTEHSKNIHRFWEVWWGFFYEGRKI